MKVLKQRGATDVTTGNAEFAGVDNAVLKQDKLKCDINSR